VHIVEYSGNFKRLLWCTGNIIYASIVLPIEARVLEVGGGQDPHPAANVIVEKFLNDNTHRMGNMPIAINNKFEKVTADGTITDTEYTPDIVCADVIELPFEDKLFDFVICKDILEHVPDIQRAAREISRVGKAGFIDVPKLTSEFLWPQPSMHIWTFTDGLIAHKIEFTSPFGNVMHKAFTENIEIQEAWTHSRQFFHCITFWNDSVDIEIGEPVTNKNYWRFT
jgi:SAM-dependent methyltransferase